MSTYYKPGTMLSLKDTSFEKRVSKLRESYFSIERQLKIKQFKKNLQIAINFVKKRSMMLYKMGKGRSEL